MNGLSSAIDGSYDFIIMAKVRANENTATTRNTGESRFYLPTEIFLPLCDNPHLVSFPFDVKEGTEAEMTDFLNSYIDSAEVGTIITSAVLGVLFSVVVVKGISSGIWFFTYQFVMWPMLAIYPFLILLTVAIPALLYRQIAKASIIERLRKN